MNNEFSYLPCQTNQMNDGVIDQQHVLARELAGDGAELLPHRLFAHGLPRHDERAAHVAVLIKVRWIFKAFLNPPHFLFLELSQLGKGNIHCC